MKQWWAHHAFFLMCGSGISSPVLYNLKQAKFTLSKLSVTHVQKKKKKLICELSVQCELHNDFIVNTVDNSNLFWWLHCWQCHFNWQRYRYLFHCLLFQWIWPIYGSNCSAISGCRIERSFSARFFSCKSPLVSSLFQRSIRRYVFSTVSLYSFSISW